jgi:hypothetical protein
VVPEPLALDSWTCYTGRVTRRRGLDPVQLFLPLLFYLLFLFLLLWPVKVLSQDSLARRPEKAPASDSAGQRTDSSVVRVCAGGDVTLGTNLDTGWVRRETGHALDSATVLRSPDSLVAPLRPLVSGANIVLLNVEGAIGEGAAPDAKCVPPHKYCYALRSPSAAAHAIRLVGDSTTVVVANLANNHAFDAGDQGFRSTISWLDSAGVMVTGTDTEPTLAVSAGGDTVAFLGFSAFTDPGVTDLDLVRRVVARTAALYRRVVVTAHLGAEGHDAQRTGDSVEHFVGEVRGNSVAFAHAAVDAGAGLVIGHGPHVLRAAEWRNGALIFYSLGNLINYGPFLLGPPLDRGAVACATLDSLGRPRDVALHPTRQRWPGFVRFDHSGRALGLVDSLSRLDFPTTGARVNRVTGAVTQRAAVHPAAVAPKTG